MDAQMASSLIDSPLILTDMNTFVEWLNKIDKEVEAGIGVDYTENDLSETNVYVAMRHQGVEFGFYKKEVEDRCKVLGKPFAIYVIRIAFGTDKEVIIRKRVF